MSYYEALGLTKEPFSTSPDPEFFYHSASHYTALKRLEISLRLRRGLNLIIGDVGTGKTTLLRALFNEFKDDTNYEFYMILDPVYKSEFQFLRYLVKVFGAQVLFQSTIDFKEAIEKYLFHKGVDEGKAVVLVIDEGQKMSFENLEALRTLLNYETNEFKLLQIVIMAQVELLPRVKRIRNFLDRVALKYTINPLDECETHEMIQFRLRQAGLKQDGIIFTDAAMRKVYYYTQGYPRRISLLCHDCLEQAVSHERTCIDEDVVWEVAERNMLV